MIHGESMSVFFQLAIIWGISIAHALCSAQETLLWYGYPLIYFGIICNYCIQWAGFTFSYIKQSEYYFDLCGAIGYITMSILLYGYGSRTTLSLFLATLIILWASRLGYFLFQRVRKDAGDSRFEKKHSFFWFFIVWNLQALWVQITAGAAFAAMVSRTSHKFSLISAIGITIWIIGFVIEIIADHQKSRFRAQPQNKERFITSGLWAYSRHPNYVGEIMLWFGIALIALPMLQSWQYISLISPIFVYILLTYISGVSLLEEKAQKRWGTDPSYMAYCQNTPILFPWWRS